MEDTKSTATGPASLRAQIAISESPSPGHAPVPRRAQVAMTELQLRKLFGLQDDESLRSLHFDPVRTVLRVVVESPRLPEMAVSYGDGAGGLVRMPSWEMEPPMVRFPLSDYYETVPADS